MAPILLNSRGARDAVIVALMTLVVFLLAGEYDILEKLVDLTRKYEDLELDELVTASVFMSFALFVFAMRRWNEVSFLHKRVVSRNHELEKAVAEIRQLKGIIPICSGCKKIRDDKGFWQQVEQYVETHSHARFSHSMCPDCLESYYGHEDWFQDMVNEGGDPSV
ncbi:MAG: hypothetical protein JEZ12_20315 [Desulfobacterium sp.]|nr:hypothetical protein [Desulfobacterium sp.]